MKFSTPSNPQECCEKCNRIGYSDEGSEIRCGDRDCPCHQRPKTSEKYVLDKNAEIMVDLSEKEETPQTSTPIWPFHSPENRSVVPEMLLPKEETPPITKREPYNQTDHYHCWQDKKPPCGQRIEHLKCCLCEKENPAVKQGEDWLEGFNEQFIKDGKLYGNHLILKDFIHQTLLTQIEELISEIAGEMFENTSEAGQFAMHADGYNQSHEEILELLHSKRETLLANQKKV